MKILAFAGSLRKRSYNKSILENAKSLAPSDMELEIFELDRIPVYDPDIEAEGIPAPVEEFKRKIEESDGLLIACPEYNYSITGVLKNAIDWASRPSGKSSLSGKPYALVGASGGISGTIRAQMHFRQIAVACNMTGMNKPEILIQKSAEKFDENGVITDEPTREQLRKFLASFHDWVNVHGEVTA